MRLISPQTLLAAAMGSAMLLGLAACGGGGAQDNALADATAGSADANDATASLQSKARPAPRPIDPNPVVVPVDATLALASTSAAGRAAEGGACAISADGSQVAFTSPSSVLVPGDSNNQSDVFVKNLGTGAIARVSTQTNAGQLQLPATCVGMTPDANFVVFTTPQVVNANGFLDPAQVIEAAIYVKNLRTGVLTNVNPPLNRFTNIARYRFQSISDDGNRVALIAEPTGTYVGGYETVANGPGRALVRDIRSGELMDLSPTVSLDVSQAAVTSELLLSPDGSKLAFNSRTNYPAVGDTNGNLDLFLVDITSRVVSMVTPAGSSPSLQSYAAVGFLANGSKLAFLAANSATATGAYIKDLGTGDTRLVFSAPVGQSLPTPFSFSDNGNLVAFTQPYFVSGRDEVIVRNVISGQEQRANITAAGVLGNGESRFPKLSSDGSRVVFDSSSSNLVRPALPAAYLYQPYVKTLTPAAGQTPG
jgi:Tol biopolymer transport system component